MYIYPDNLKSRATLWLWQLKDLGITGVCAVASVLALTHEDEQKKNAHDHQNVCVAFGGIRQPFHGSADGSLCVSDDPF